ncbi:LegC family aminotransferase [uncultured Eubacterium sp.]|uniref:LegC family aminotransferase n=1 Tax=uncultured Eubacterium sp. TaxID=165185 RepID=UPI0032660BF6
MENFIPLSIPNFEGNEEKYVLDAVHQGWVSTGGAYIVQFEEKLAAFLRVEKAAACQSGTSALHLALVACNVKPGDLVIVPTVTFIAAVNPVKYQFAEPVFMDCDDSLCMNPEKLRSFCEIECELQEEHLVYKKTGQVVKAVVVVHVFGNLADMEQIMEIAGQYHLKVIEDATEALGSHFTDGKYAGKMAGTIGDYGAYSFNGNKIITTGGGGAITAKNPSDLDYVKYLSTQAKDDALYYVHNEIGYNYRMTNVQAAIGVAQLELLSEFIQRKQKNYDTYQKCLKKIGLPQLLEFRQGTESNKWFYSFPIPKECAVEVRTLIESLQNEKIQTRPIWGLIHEQKPYQSDIAYEIEKAKEYSRCIINVPCSTNLTEEEIERVVHALQRQLEGKKEYESIR